MKTKPYPKAGPMGGRLIRETIRALRSAGIQLPTTSHILIAVSAGSDSLALAHLLAKYGRRIAPRAKITLIHANHGWRGGASDADAAHVRAMGRQWRVKTKTYKLTSAKPHEGSGESWEAYARRARGRFFERRLKEAGAGALLLTAHHADDLAETLLWRMFTGAGRTHGGGILVKNGPVVRPWLRVRKRDLQNYLHEEGVHWHEDSTNHDPRFLRARMRQELLPIVESIFPRAVPQLVEHALNTQLLDPEMAIAAEAMIGAAGLRLKRAHLKSMSSGRSSDLPAGWRLRKETDRWILERSQISETSNKTR